jgi:hypothetical protein
MFSISKTTKIQKIRELSCQEPDTPQQYWLLENSQYSLYNPMNGTWEPVKPEQFTPGKRDFLFAHDDDELPPFPGQVFATVGPITTRKYLETCQCDKAEIDTRLKALGTVKEFADEIMKAIFINN